jgi:hypothetical protein
MEDLMMPEQHPDEATIKEAMAAVGRPIGDPTLDRLLDKMRSECLMCGRDKRDKETEPCDHCAPRPEYPVEAPAGTVYVCGACGKTSSNLYGEGGGNLGWDESCMLNAVLCDIDSLTYKEGRVVKADAAKGREGV